MSKRIMTDYPGVAYREANRIGRRGKERVYYILFKKDGRLIEEKVGRQFSDNMTPAKVAGIRSERIEGKRLSRREARAREEARRRAEADKWTIARLWEHYEAQKEDGKGIQTDRGRYRLYIEPGFAEKEPREIIQLDVDRLRKKLSKKLQPQTAKHVLGLLKRIANFGKKKGLCEGLGFDIEMPRVNNLRTEDLTQDQLKDLLEAIDADTNIHAANMMRLVLYTGMRRGELFRLKWDDIDNERGFIHLRNPKGGVDQKIPLNEGSRGVLQAHIRTDSPYVFPGRGGRQRVDVNHQVNRIKKRAGLPEDFRPLHGLRHAYASMMASSGKVDMYTLQKLLTHKHPRMTQRYAHLHDDTLKRASEVAFDIISSAVTNKRKIIPIESTK